MNVVNTVMTLNNVMANMMWGKIVIKGIMNAYNGGRERLFVFLMGG
jgi:hypothetical protein